MLATFLFTVPISVKIMHVIRAQVRKILVAMVRLAVDLLLRVFCHAAFTCTHWTQSTHAPLLSAGAGRG